MDITESLQFDHQDRKDIYDYIERNGTVREAEVRRALNLDPAAMGSHVTVLRRDGYIRKVGNKLQVAYQDEEASQHDCDGLSVTIRAAQEVDRDDLTEAIREVAEEGSDIEAETVADVIDHEEVLFRHNDVESRLFFVATVDDEVAGWVHLDLPEAEKLRHTAVLTVGVRNDYRGHGIGAALLDRGMGWARDKGFEKLYNSVPATNETAIDFLESHGWEIETVREDHYKIGDDYVDEVMLAVEL